MLDLDTLDFAKGGGLVTVVAQDAASGAVLMVAGSVCVGMSLPCGVAVNK